MTLLALPLAFALAVPALEPDGLIPRPDDAGRCPAGPLTLPAAIAHARGAPDVTAGDRAGAAFADGARATPWLLGNPTLSATGGARLFPVAAVGPEGSAAVTMPVRLGAPGVATARALDADAQLARASGDVRGADRARAAAIAFIELQALTETFAVLELELETAARTVALAETAVAAGVEGRLALEAVRARASATRLERLDVEGAIVDARFALADALGCVEADALTVDVAPLVALPSPLAERDVAMARLDAESRAIAARDEEITRTRFGQLDVGVTGEGDGPSTGRVLGTLAYTLPVFERGDAARAELAARAHDVDAARALRARSRARSVALLDHEIAHTREVLDVLDDEALPAAITARDAALALLAVGETSALDVLTLERDVQGLRRARIAARARHDRARVERALLPEPFAERSHP